MVTTPVLPHPLAPCIIQAAQPRFSGQKGVVTGMGTEGHRLELAGTQLFQLPWFCFLAAVSSVEWLSLLSAQDGEGDCAFAFGMGIRI